MAYIVKIRWTTLALEDFNQAREFIAQERPTAVAGIVRQVDHALDAILRYPDIGRAGRIAGTRELYVVNTPFIVVYRFKSKMVEILAFMHTSRRWPDSFE